MAQDFNIRLSKVKVALPGGRLLFQIPELTLAAGTHTLVQGESGSGKTTFLHLLAGLFKPTEGDVYVGPNHLNQLNDNSLCDMRQQHVGVIFQKLNLIDHLTVNENVALSLSNSLSDKDDVVQRATSRVNLKGRGRDRCSYLSLGEQQRVAVARVLAQGPDVILADEPTSSLDQTNCNFVMQALREAARGKTLIVVSHDHRLEDQFEKVIQFKDYAR